MAERLTGIEVVGFEGTAPGECGRCSAIVLETKSGQYFNLAHESAGRGAATRHSRDEIESFQKAGLLTLLFESVPAVENAVVVYVRESFLSVLGQRPPAFHGAELWNWQQVPYVWRALPDGGRWAEGTSSAAGEESGPNICWAASADKDTVDRLLNSWSRSLLRDANNAMEGVLSSGCAERHRQAELKARCSQYAAYDRSLRAEVLVTLGLVFLYSESPGRLESLYRLVVQPEYPTLTRSRFDEHVDQLAATLRRRSALRSNGCGRPSWRTEHHATPDQDSGSRSPMEDPVLVEWLTESRLQIQALPSGPTQRGAATFASREFRRRTGATLAATGRALEAVQQPQTRLLLQGQLLYAFASLPTFYWSKAVRWTGTSFEVQRSMFADDLRSEDDQQPDDLVILAKAILQPGQSFVGDRSASPPS
jgi:hypothetical protein